MERPERKSERRAGAFSEEEKVRWRWRRSWCGSEGRHGGPEWLRRVQPASASIEAILSIAGVSTTSFGVGLVVEGLEDLGGGKGGTKEEEAGRLREGICWWRNTILFSFFATSFTSAAVISASVLEGD